MVSMRLVILLLLFVGLSASADTDARFERAASAIEAGRFAEGVLDYESLARELPTENWPEAQQHQLAMGYYGQRAYDRAQALWSHLLCQSPRGLFAFRAAYNLALAQYNLGQARRARKTLELIPADLVEVQPAAAKKAYRALLAELSRHSPPERPLKNDSSGINDLKVIPVLDQSTIQEGRTTRTLEVLGRYQPGQNWQLTCGGMPLALTKDGVFRLRLLAVNNVAYLQLAAHSPTRSSIPYTAEFMLAEGKQLSRPSEEVIQKTLGTAEPSVETPTAPHDSMFTGRDLQAGLVMHFTSRGWQSLSPRFSWTPILRIDEKVALRLNLGLSLIRKIGSGQALAIDSFLLYSRDLTPSWQGEIGAGAESWLGYGGTLAGVRATLAHRVRAALLGDWQLDRALVSYTYLLGGGSPQSLFLGLGLNF